MDEKSDPGPERRRASSAVFLPGTAVAKVRGPIKLESMSRIIAVLTEVYGEDLRVSLADDGAGFFTFVTPDADDLVEDTRRRMLS